MGLGFYKPCASGGRWKLRSWKEVIGDKDHGWSSLLWVLYLGFFFVDPVMRHASLQLWLTNLAGAAAFLILYFGLFFLEHPYALAHIGGMVMLGLGYQFINEGACTFLIFACAML